jgi:hypothetical protein
MANYSLSVDLTKLNGAQLQTSQEGQLCLIIPVEQADLYLSEKNHVYLGLNMWAKRNVDPSTGLDSYGKSHDLQINLSKAKRDALPAGTYPPSLGSAKPIVPRNAANSQYNLQNQQPPQGFQPVNPPQNFATVGTDLPF